MPQSQSGTPSVGWIKFFAIVTAWLTIILVALIIVLGMFVWRLEVLTDSLVASRRSAQLSSPTAEQSPTPTPTTEPVPKSNTHSYADNDAIAKSSPYASASSDSSPPTPIASPLLFFTQQ